MKPFVLLATRPEDPIADAEHAQFCRAAGLAPEQLRRIRLEQAPLPDLDLAEHSGVIIAGSPFNSSDAPETKSALQRRVETDLVGLLDRAIAQDVPLLGACYGVGTLGLHQGASVDRAFAEPAGAIEVRLTDAGREDPLVQAAGLPEAFAAIVGHKEAVSALPEHAVLLATGDACPVQMFRIGQRQYATQFHPELDAEGLAERLHAYLHAGYIDPSELDDVLAAVRRADLAASAGVLRGFVELFAR